MKDKGVTGIQQVEAMVSVHHHIIIKSDPKKGWGAGGVAKLVKCLTHNE